MKSTHTQNVRNQKYDRGLIMRRAWKFHRSNKYETFSECLTASWAIAKNKTHNISFNKLYSDHYHKILSVVKMKTNNSIESEDLTSEILFKVYENLDLYDSTKSKLSTWIFTITNRMVIDHYRKNKNGGNISHIDNFVDAEGKETFQIESNLNENTIENIELNESVIQAVKNLNPKEQEITKLYFLEQKQYKEVSEILQIPVGSVKGTISRIRAKLQESLQDEYTML